ncbi:hypothetical protein PSPO01_14142 [Paraphaeosphaeria sporulosa]
MPPMGEYDAAPPPYTSHSITAAAADDSILDRCEWSSAKNLELPTATQCATHLKLLHAFARLRKEVGWYEGLYGIKFEAGT